MRRRHHEVATVDDLGGVLRPSTGCCATHSRVLGVRVGVGDGAWPNRGLWEGTWEPPLSSCHRPAPAGEPLSACPSAVVHILVVPEPYGCCVSVEHMLLGSPAQDTHTTPPPWRRLPHPGPRCLLHAPKFGFQFAGGGSVSALFILVVADPAHGAPSAGPQHPATRHRPRELQLHAAVLLLQHT